MTSTTPETLNLSVDLDDLTLDEIDVVESITGQALDDLGEPGALKGPLLRALAVLTKHREDPEGYPIATPADIEGSKLRVGSLRLKLDASVESDNSGNVPEQPAP